MHKIINNFSTSIKHCYDKMFDFNGRSSRSEFWYFQLYVIFVFLLFVIISENLKSREIIGYLSAFFAFFFILALLIPMISTRFRRLHDTNKSGWYLLLGFIPIVGGLILLIMYCKKSDGNKNQYDTKPKV